PGARCTRGLVCKDAQKSAHEHTGTDGAIRLSLRDGFTAYFVLSPVTGLSCHRHPQKRASANLTPASGRQDHTTSPYATRLRQEASPGSVRVRRSFDEGANLRSSSASRRSPASPRNVRDDRDPPLIRVRRAESNH